MEHTSTCSSYTCFVLPKPCAAVDRVSIISLVNEAFMEDAFFKVDEKKQRLKQSSGDTKGVEDLDEILTKSEFIVCVDKNSPGRVILGCIRVETVSPTKASFGMLAVPERNARRGIGTALVLAAETWAKEHTSCKEMEISVVDIRENVVRFYTKLGYRETGQAVDFDEMLGASFLNEEYKDKVKFLIMVKSLT